jgi:UDP-glucose 4-epimerase
MKILVTGSEGSLMQAIIPKLLAQGHSVTGVDNLYRYGKQSNSAGVNYEFIRMDLTDSNKTIDLCCGYDVVFLAAAKIYGVGGFNYYCADILSDDITIQRNVLRSCALHNSTQRVVYISSSMVYETCIQDINYPVTEDLVDDCILPKTEYGVSKLIGERMCQAFKKQYNIDYTIWRPFNIITPHEQSMSEQGFSHVFSDFITNIVDKKLNPLPIIGDGNQIRCFTWIDDVAEIIATYSTRLKTINQAYNICNVEPMSMRNLAEKIFLQSGQSGELKFQTIKNYKNDVIVRVPSIKKLIDTIGPYQFKNTEFSVNQCLSNHH